MAWQWEKLEEISDSLYAYTSEQGFQSLFSHDFPQLWKIAGMDLRRVFKMFKVSQTVRREMNPKFKVSSIYT